MRYPYGFPSSRGTRRHDGRRDQIGDNLLQEQYGNAFHAFFSVLEGFVVMGSAMLLVGDSEVLSGLPII